MATKPRHRFNKSKQRITDESVEFWETALKYVKSETYSPESYNARFGDVPFAWCRYIELIGGVCGDCELFDGDWCGSAPYINKTQPESLYCISEEFGKVVIVMMPKEELAKNIEAFIDVLKNITW